MIERNGLDENALYEKVLDENWVHEVFLWVAM